MEKTLAIVVTLIHYTLFASQNYKWGTFLMLKIIILIFTAIIFSGKVYTETIRAISLNRIQSLMKDSQQREKNIPELYTLGGITKIQGYIYDDEHEDIILYGIVDTNLPPLLTENFVISLRNTWLMYSELRNNTRYYSNPGCSIDPQPDVLQQLSQLQNTIPKVKSNELMQQVLEQWNVVCKGEQKVRVLGIPWNTSFAKIMVDADYLMKRIVDGSMQLEIDGFKSAIDIRLDSVKKAMEQDKPISFLEPIFNRFWFSPGRNIYTENENIIEVTQCPITLLTEEEHVTKGIRKASGNVNMIANIFAETFTNNFHSIAHLQPIFAELEGLFRFVVLSKILNYKTVDFDFDYFLHDFPISTVEVSSTLGGIANIKSYTLRKELQSGYREQTYWLPSCGGVGINLTITKSNFIQDDKNVLENIKRNVLASIPSNEALFWDIQN
ncbi:MAG: DUF1598 domain-containing protein [Bacteroidetes bacterium]|nr:MAG: DUF1598 domain-containing protein [Bacteroidota bacterium]